jgi:hypothetical protein
MSKTINGPINIIRLTNGKKVLYLMGDIHVPLERQTKSSDLSSLSIVQYLDQFIKQTQNSTITYDIMIEASYGNNTSEQFNEKMENVKSKEMNTAKKYLLEMEQLMAQYFKIDPKGTSDSKYKIIQSTQYKVRFHNTNIRDTQTCNILFKTFPALENLNKKRNHNSVTTMIEHLNTTMEHVQLNYDALYLSKDAKTANTFTEQMYDKLKTKYNHDDVKNTITTIINNDLKTSMLEYIQAVQEFISFLEKDDEEYKIKYWDGNRKKQNASFQHIGYQIDPVALPNYVHIHKTIYKLRWQFSTIYCLITDIYTIRRIIDKPYVTNTIAYTGMLHTTQIMYLLIKHFGFEITHLSYSQHDIKTTNETIRQMKRFQELSFAFMYPPYWKQYSSLEGFPEKFK